MALPSCTSSSVQKTASLARRYITTTRNRIGLPQKRIYTVRSFSNSTRRSEDAAPSTEVVSTLKEYRASYVRNFNEDGLLWENPSQLLGSTITVNGFLGLRVDTSKTLSFAPLYRENPWSPPIQIVSKGSSVTDAVHLRFKSLKPHSAVSLTALVKERRQPRKGTLEGSGSNDTSGTYEGALETLTSRRAGVELILQDVQCLSAFPDDIIVSKDSQFGPSQRHLQMRFNGELAQRLGFRQRLIRILRKYLEDFLEVETPILFKSTPEGAREFLVPTRRAGFSYALPQSPQQYKQVLMASGIGNYFQIAKCFRDEDLRADRQPEFTQLDLEMPFADGVTIMTKIEALVKSVYQEVDIVKMATPQNLDFPRMTYEQAMDKHGVDKPDLRIKSLINRIDPILASSLINMMTSIHKPIVEAVKFSISDDASTTRRFVNEFMDSSDAAAFQQNVDGPPGVFIYDPTKPLEGLQAFGFEGVEALHELYNGEDALQPGDLLILQARANLPHSGGSTALGRIRTAIQKKAVEDSLIQRDEAHHYLWVTDFPMFTLSTATPTDPGQGGTAGFNATHHPFTAPKTSQDVDLLFSSPLDAKADHYDLVVNGIELGGGSKRIHNAEIQKYVMRKVLKMSEVRMADFNHLFEALRCGCPPHAGIALGLDRWVAILTGVESVRDVIAFPKSGKGEDLMVGSPTRMTKEQQATYHLEVKE